MNFYRTKNSSIYARLSNSFKVALPQPVCTIPTTSRASCKTPTLSSNPACMSDTVLFSLSTFLLAHYPGIFAAQPAPLQQTTVFTASFFVFTQNLELSSANLAARMAALRHKRAFSATKSVWLSLNCLAERHFCQRRRCRRNKKREDAITVTLTSRRSSCLFISKAYPGDAPLCLRLLFQITPILEYRNFL